METELRSLTVYSLVQLWILLYRLPDGRMVSRMLFSGSAVHLMSQVVRIQHDEEHAWKHLNVSEYICIFLKKCVNVSLITFKCYSGMQFLVRLQENTLKPSNTSFIKIQKCIFTMNIFFFPCWVCTLCNKSWLILLYSTWV